VAADKVIDGVPGRLVGVVPIGRAGRSRTMRTADLASPFPTVIAQTPAIEAARLPVGQNLPGLIVVDDRRCPVTIMPDVLLDRVLAQ
jgi:hypothetical protein